MIIGKVIDSGIAAHRDFVDVSVTLRVPRRSFASWGDEKQSLLDDVSRGRELAITSQKPPADDGEDRPISSALQRYVERADSDDGEPVDDITGAAYVFRNDGDGWYQMAKLLASDGMPADIFGCSVAIDGDMILVGATGDDNPLGSNAGAVYVYIIPEPSTFVLLGGALAWWRRRK